MNKFLDDNIRLICFIMVVAAFAVRLFLEVNASSEVSAANAASAANAEKAVNAARNFFGW